MIDKKNRRKWIAGQVCPANGSSTVPDVPLSRAAASRLRPTGRERIFAIGSTSDGTNVSSRFSASISERSNPDSVSEPPLFNSSTNAIADRPLLPRPDVHKREQNTNGIERLHDLPFSMPTSRQFGEIIKDFTPTKHHESLAKPLSEHRHILIYPLRPFNISFILRDRIPTPPQPLPHTRLVNPRRPAACRTVYHGRFLHPLPRPIIFRMPSRKY